MPRDYNLDGFTVLVGELPDMETCQLMGGFFPYVEPSVLGKLPDVEPWVYSREGLVILGSILIVYSRNQELFVNFPSLLRPTFWDYSRQTPYPQC